MGKIFGSRSKKDKKNLNLYLLPEQLKNQHQNGLGVMENIM